MEPAEYEDDEPTDIPSCAVIDMTALVEEVSEMSEESQNPTAVPADDSSSEPTQAAPAAEDVWVLVNTASNPNQDQTSFYGGGQTEGYFTEARFKGKSLVFNCSEGSFSFTDVDVDHEYTYHNITLTAKYDIPPATLVPGEEVTLSASASHSGSINEGGSGGGLVFQYHISDHSLEPVLSYFPWAPTFDETSTGSWSFNVPAAVEGGEFMIYAGLWNSPPCHVIWTYHVQAGD